MLPSDGKRQRGAEPKPCAAVLLLGGTSEASTWSVPPLLSSERDRRGRWRRRILRVSARSPPRFPPPRKQSFRPGRECASGHWDPAARPRAFESAQVFLETGGMDGGHGTSQSFDPADQVPPKSLRRLLGHDGDDLARSCRLLPPL